MMGLTLHQARVGAPPSPAAGAKLQPRAQVCWRCMNRSSKDEDFGKVRDPPRLALHGLMWVGIPRHEILEQPGNWKLVDALFLMVKTIQKLVANVIEQQHQLQLNLLPATVLNLRDS